MKYQQMKWISVSVLLVTFTVVLALKQADFQSPNAELKPVKLKVITAENVTALDIKVSRPMGVAVRDKLIAIADAGNKRVIIFNNHNDNQVIINKAGKLGEMSYPVDIAFGPKKSLYVADIYGGRILQFDDKGAFIKAFPDAAAVKKVGGISPAALTVDPKGRLYVTDVGMHRVVVFDDKGKFLFQFGKAGSKKGQMLYPNGISVNNSTGDVYVADTNNSRVQIFNRKGVLKGVLALPEGVAAPRGMDFTEGNELVFASTLTNQLYKVNPDSGEAQLISIKMPLSYPNDLAIHNGKYYVVDRGNDRLLSFSIKKSEVKRSEK